MITNSLGNAQPTPPPLLKVRDVAKALSLSRQTIKALIDSGDLHGRPLGPTRRKAKRIHMRVTRESLAKFFKKRFDRELDANLQPQPLR